MGVSLCLSTLDDLEPVHVHITTPVRCFLLRDLVVLIFCKCIKLEKKNIWRIGRGESRRIYLFELVHKGANENRRRQKLKIRAIQRYKTYLI